MKVAAVYMNSVLGNVEKNLKVAESYIKEAAEKQVEIIALPEFFTTGFAITPKMISSIIPSSKTLDIMKEWVKKYHVTIGGSYLEFDAQKQEIYNTYSLVLSTGEVYQHRKDIPTAAENFCYTYGDEKSCFDTPIGRVGIAMCWEMIRHNTIRRMLGKVDFVMAGSCWWNLCKEDGEDIYNMLSEPNKQLALKAPQNLAKLLGVPVIHASHKSSFNGSSLFDETKMCTRPIVGMVQIINGEGEPLTILEEENVPDLILEDIELDTKLRTSHTVYQSESSDYWVCPMPEGLVKGFEMLNQKYEEIYIKETLPAIKQACIKNASYLGEENHTISK